eukprot:7353728-Prymnesium_polylepis.1
MQGPCRDPARPPSRLKWTSLLHQSISRKYTTQFPPVKPALPPAEQIACWMGAATRHGRAVCRRTSTQGRRTRGHRKRYPGLSMVGGALHCECGKAQTQGGGR